MGFISNANILDEDMANITDWDDIDGGDGVSSQVSFDGKSTMKLLTGSSGAGNFAGRKADVGTFGARVVLSTNTYFDSIGTMGANDAMELQIYDGSTDLIVYFASDGLYIHDGASFNEVGTDLIVQDTWQEWTFDINWTAQTVDVYLGGVLQVAGVDCSLASGIANGTVQWRQLGNTTASQLSYIDWVKVGDDFEVISSGFTQALIIS